MVLLRASPREQRSKTEGNTQRQLTLPYHDTHTHTHIIVYDSDCSYAGAKDMRLVKIQTRAVQYYGCHHESEFWFGISTTIATSASSSSNASATPDGIQNTTRRKDLVRSCCPPYVRKRSDWKAPLRVLSQLKVQRGGGQQEQKATRGDAKKNGPRRISDLNNHPRNGVAYKMGI